MIYSHLLHNNDRTALAARDILSFKRHSGIGALLLMLVLGAGLLGGSPSLYAQEHKSAAPPAAAQAATKVNINTADVTTLAANLKGVGETRAQEIVRYREAYGPFASAEELTEVKGIGKSTLDMNRDVITLE
jgi:competence protein ComEA